MLDSVRTRLTLWYVVVLGLVLIACNLGVYALLARTMHDRLDASLRAALQATAFSLGRERAEGKTAREAAISALEELYSQGQAVSIFDAAGKLIAEKTAPGVAPARLPASAVSDETTLFTLPADKTAGNDYRAAAQRVWVETAGTSYQIVVSQPLKNVREELELLRRVLYAVVPAALVLAGLGGWFLARKSLAPVVTMSERARRISAESLGQQLPVANPRDELGRLAITFNDLFARLADAFARQRQFMADASHELRTPLYVTHTAAQVTMDRPHRTEEEYRETLAIVIEETRRLTRIVEEMLTLAHADARQRTLHLGDFSLDDLLAETARAMNVLAAQKSVVVETAITAPARFCGDESLLRRMALNLLDNAIKHTPVGGLVRVGLERRDDHYLLTVSDTGEGIPVAAQPHIFERFYRADKARSRAETGDGSGAGLGLSIARWVAEAHEGRLELARSDASGSTFIASLPLRHSL
jgi:two-component system, OmpR family, sensor kinase